MTLEERLARLEATVEDLTMRLGHAKPGQVHSMAHTHRCPACGGTTLLHVRRLKESTHGGLVDLTLHKQHSFWSTTFQGALEAYACRTCRLVELHAVTLEDVVVDGDDVIEITAPPDPLPDGVYR